MKMGLEYFLMLVRTFDLTTQYEAASRPGVI